ncbi:MAG: hypothetical protein KAV87_24045 [Desulfobacteraceae bacterium]|nr:hypothetical protein [Desulfobacteraceae bacterium]
MVGGKVVSVNGIIESITVGDFLYIALVTLIIGLLMVSILKSFKEIKSLDSQIKQLLIDLKKNKSSK